MTTPKCAECQLVHPRHCDRCRYLMDNMGRWRKVAEQLHAETCTHREDHKPSICSKHLEAIYNAFRAEDAR